MREEADRRRHSTARARARRGVGRRDGSHSSYFVLKRKIGGADRTDRQTDRQTDADGERARETQPFHGGRDFGPFRLLRKIHVLVLALARSLAWTCRI